jgi:hypothetical protein
VRLPGGAKGKSAMAGLNTVAIGVAIGVATSATVHPALAIILVLLLVLVGLARAALRT